MLAKRRNESRREGWDILGGFLEVGENVKQTLIREVKEETGLEVADPEHVDIVDKIDFDEDGGTRYHFIIIAIL